MKYKCNIINNLLASSSSSDSPKFGMPVGFGKSIKAWHFFIINFIFVKLFLSEKPATKTGLLFRHIDRQTNLADFECLLKILQGYKTLTGESWELKSIHLQSCHGWEILPQSGRPNIKPQAVTFFTVFSEIFRHVGWLQSTARWVCWTPQILFIASHWETTGIHTV